MTPLPDPQDVLQTQKIELFYFRSANTPPQAVFIPVDTKFTVEECGNYRKLRFQTNLPEGAQGAQGVEIEIGGEKREVFSVDVTMTQARILRLLANPFQPSVFWETAWEESEEGWERFLSAWGQPMRVSVTVKEQDIAFEPEAVHKAVSEHLRGAAREKLLAKFAWFEALVPSKSKETRVVATVVVQNI